MSLDQFRNLKRLYLCRYHEMKYRIFTALFLCFLVFGNLTGNAASPSTWVINPNKVPSFKATPQKRLIEALSNYKIKVIYDQTLEAKPSNSVPFRSQVLIPLIVGKYVSVCLVRPSLEELHVGLKVKNLSTLKGDALREFREMLQDVIQTFQDLGYGDYLAFCDFGKKYYSTSGKTIKGNFWEMIPLGKGHVKNKDGVYLLTPKIWRSNYVLFNQTPNFQETNPTIVTKFVRLLQLHILHKIPSSLFFCKETLPWRVNIPDLNEAQQESLKRVLFGLQHVGAVRVIASSSTTNSSKTTYGEMDKPDGEFTTTRIKERATCAFCKEEVLKKQKMISSKKVIILYNNEPYTKNAHFMIIPLKHQESLHCLMLDQFEEIIQKAQTLNLALGDIKNLVWFCQNGPRAGQTVPHFHLHVLRRPNPITLPIKILNELAGHKDAPVEEQEYQINQDWLLNRLKTLGL